MLVSQSSIEETNQDLAACKDINFFPSGLMKIFLNSLEFGCLAEITFQPLGRVELELIFLIEDLVYLLEIVILRVIQESDEMELT